MSTRMLSTLIAGAFATALGSLSAAPAGAQEFTQAQKNIQAEHTTLVKSGKLEPCFGTAAKGQNDCYAGCGNDLRRNQHDRLAGQCVQAGAEGQLYFDPDAQGQWQPLAQDLANPLAGLGATRPVPSFTGD